MAIKRCPLPIGHKAEDTLCRKTHLDDSTPRQLLSELESHLDDIDEKVDEAIQEKEEAEENYAGLIEESRKLVDSHRTLLSVLSDYRAGIMSTQDLNYWIVTEDWSFERTQREWDETITEQEKAEQEKKNAKRSTPA